MSVKLLEHKINLDINDLKRLAQTGDDYCSDSLKSFNIKLNVDDMAMLAQIEEDDLFSSFKSSTDKINLDVNDTGMITRRRKRNKRAMAIFLRAIMRNSLSEAC